MRAGPHGGGALRPVFLLALLVVAPLAAADHVYSHRLVVTGRVVDPDGAPVAGQAVALTVVGLQVGGPCFDSGEERTGPRGDYRLCRHAHAMPAGVRVNVTAAGASGEADVDPALRRAAVHLRTPEPVPGGRDVEGERTFARTFRVEGRVMTAATGPAQVEGVNVTALPEQGRPVNVTLTLAGETLAAADATTDEHGDYAVDLAVDDVPAGARVRLTTEGAQRDAPADAAVRRADLDLVLPGEETPPTLEPPGTRTPRVPLPWPLAVLALAAAGLVLRKR